MKLVTDTIYDILAADATILAALATYKSLPAIFQEGDVPEEADKPYIVLPAPASDLPDDTQTSQGRDLLLDASVFATNDGDPTTVDAIKERVRVLLHHIDPPIAGFTVAQFSVTGIVADRDEYVYHRAITVRVRLTQQ